MSEEPNNNEKSTSINDLVEEVERLLREVEEKEKEESKQEKEEDIADEIKNIIEAPVLKRSRKKVEKEEKEIIETENKTEEPKRRRGRPRKVVPVEEVVTIEEKIIGKHKDKKEEKIFEDNFFEDKKVENKIIEEPKIKELKKEVEIEKKIVIEKEKVEGKKAEIIEKEVSKELITLKGETKELTITKEQLAKIEDEIRKQKDIPKQDRDIINKKIFKNIMIGIFIVAYFISINLGFLKLKEDTFLNDIRVFSGILIAATIFIFEKAYRKESKEFAILGIETLILSITTLLTNYVYTECYGKFLYMTNSVSMLFATYYVGKSIISYIKMRKRALKKISDIRNIISRSKV